MTDIPATAARVSALAGLCANNVASKCDGHGHRIFVTSNKDPAPSNMVVINDQSCGR